MHKIVGGSIFRAGVGGLKLPQYTHCIRPCYNLQSDKHSMPNMPSWSNRARMKDLLLRRTLVVQLVQPSFIA